MKKRNSGIIRNWLRTLVPNSYRIWEVLRCIFCSNSSLFSEGKMDRYAVQMLKSGETLTRVTLTITPLMARVWLWKIRLNSFCRSLHIRFCRVSCIILSQTSKVKGQRFWKAVKILFAISSISLAGNASFSLRKSMSPSVSIGIRWI